jgi:hypothetical protein
MPRHTRPVAIPASGTASRSTPHPDGNLCVLFTANDAYMRELKLFAPADCIASNTAEDNEHALRQIETVLKGNTAISTRLTFRHQRRRHRSRRS